jgi:putative tryptophan/tyrosine transport system substrate-binding protein
VKRRTFIAGLGSAVAWPVVAEAQQPERMRQIGMLIGFDENDLEAKGWLSAFTKGLADAGWTDGHNLRIHVRWAAGNVERMRLFAKELVDLQPEVILAHSTPVTASLQRETTTIPIVFVLVGDPVGDGFVISLPRPGGNITGFMTQEATIASKWLELLTGTSKNCHCPSGATNSPANDSALFSFRFCAVHPQRDPQLPATAIFRGPLK